MQRFVTGLGAGIASAALLAVTSPALSGGSGGCGSGKKMTDAVMMGAVSGTKDIVDTAVAAGQFKTLAAALGAAGLVDALKGDGPFTVFAPTDEAFAALPAGTVENLLKPENKEKLQAVLKYHVVSGLVTSKSIAEVPVAGTLQGQLIKPVVKGEAVTINGVNVVKADIGATNGVIHVIDRVLLPESKNIPQLATDDGRFNTLVAALKAAGLVEILSGPGPFTVFGPTDEAFAKLPKPVLEALLKPENKALLTEILTYHVVKGRVSTVDAMEAGKVATLEGSDARIAGSGDNLTINNARIMMRDVNASNGVGHVIDTVLIPAKAAEKIGKLTMDGMAPAQRVIAAAIERGAPMFNHGNPEACAAIYETAMTAILAMPEGTVSASDRTTLTKAMKEGGRTHAMSDRAWVYRRAMDQVMASAPEAMASR